MEELSRREEKIKKVKEQRQLGMVILEDIHDPHNSAAVWRSCDAFGVGKVYLIFDKEKHVFSSSFPYFLSSFIFSVYINF